MKNKKGFTLVELLAVIAILAILVLLALPNVLKQFGNAKKSAFETEVKELITQAESDFISDTMFNTTSKTYNSESNPLSLSGNDLEYDINMDTKGNITCIQVSNGSYQFTYSGDGITKSDEITATDKEEDFTPSCDPNKVTYTKAKGTCFKFDSSTGTIEHYYYYENNDSSMDRCPTNVEIPDTIDGVQVNAIGDYAFTTQADFELVSMNSNDNEYNVIKIRRSVASGMGIENVKIPNTVTSIGKQAFQGNNIKTVILPSNLTTLGVSAFADNKIEYLNVPGSLETIPDYAFIDNQISTLVLNKGLKKIDIQAFSNNKLTTINFPEGVEYLDTAAFSDNLFEELYIDNIERVNMSSFNYRQSVSLKKVTFGNNVKEICNEIFSFSYNNYGYDYGCKIEEVVISSSIKTIGKASFYECPIKKLTLNEGVEKIEQLAFYKNQLLNISIPSTVKSIEYSAFYLNYSKYNEKPTIQLEVKSSSTFDWTSIFNNYVDNGSFSMKVNGNKVTSDRFDIDIINN